ncbi:MAG: hypothetical protein ACK5A0_11790 [Polaromonas sp.]
MSTGPAPHLIVPFASCSHDDWLQAMSSTTLKNLGQLLRGMKLMDTDVGQPDSLSPPHERLLAKALCLPASADGLIPWAARQAHANCHEGWAVITPCHWAMGREHATLTDPATLELNDTDSRALLAAMQPYFATEGITLNYAAPTRWLAEGDVFKSLPTASLDRVLGRNVERWLPQDERRDGPPRASSAPSGGSVVRKATSVGARPLKLLQNEMQMLLYTHPVNDERAAKGQRSINSFWVSGSGALIEPARANTHVDTSRALAQAAFANDWAAYAHAWTQLDASDIAHLLARQNSGNTVRISLCGESQGMTFETTQNGWLTKIRQAFSPQPAIHVLQQL